MMTFRRLCDVAACALRLTPTTLVFATAILGEVRWERWLVYNGCRTRQQQQTKTKDENALFTELGSSIILLAISAVLWRLPPHSAVMAFWKPTTWLLAQWPVAFSSLVPVSVVNGGPLGPSCSKLCQVLAGALLWKISHNVWPPIALGSPPSLLQLLFVGLLSGAVNLVLAAWSSYYNSRGNHGGVQDMVQESIGRSLSPRGHVKLLFMAFANAACEEVTSRGLLRTEFELAAESFTGSTENYDSDNKLLYSNLWQALVFGIWHYNGIPSGVPGVVLTFVYGLIMGLLADYNDGGLFAPILAHTVADYFIFSFIARRQRCQRRGRR